MPDLATHALITYTGTRLWGVVRKTNVLPQWNVYLIVLGGILPDLMDKSIPYALNLLFPETANDAFSLSFLHSPLMLVVSVYAFSLLFSESFRRKVFFLLLSGVSVHLLLDFLQGNICGTGYLWFFPFSTSRPMGVNWFYDDSTVRLIPMFVVLLLCLEIAICVMRRRSASKFILHQ